MLHTQRTQLKVMYYHSKHYKIIHFDNTNEWMTIYPYEMSTDVEIVKTSFWCLLENILYNDFTQNSAELNLYIRLVVARISLLSLVLIILTLISTYAFPGKSELRRYLRASDLRTWSTRSNFYCFSNNSELNVWMRASSVIHVYTSHFIVLPVTKGWREHRDYIIGLFTSNE